MTEHRPGSNGRLSITLRVGDAADVTMLIGTEAHKIRIACDSTDVAAETCSFMLSAWAGCLLCLVNAEPVAFDRTDRFVRLRPRAKFSIAAMVGVTELDSVEVYITEIGNERVIVSIDAPRDWKISRAMRDAA